MSDLLSNPTFSLSLRRWSDGALIYGPVDFINPNPRVEMTQWQTFPRMIGIYARLSRPIAKADTFDMTVHDFASGAVLKAFSGVRLTLLEMRNDVPPSVNVAFDATYLRLVAGVAGSTKRANDVQSADVFALMDACSRLEAPGLAQSRIDALMGVVRARMATYGMTPTQLAVRLGVSTQTVKAWLAGQACMRAQSVWMMCEALGIEIETR